jgi:hypothetical protein
MKSLRSLAVAAILLVATLNLAAQQAPTQAGQDAHTSNPASAQTEAGENKLMVRSNLVFLPTRVQNKKGETIYGIKPEQFIIEDNGVRQSVHIEEGPDFQGLSLVVVVQCGRSAAAELSKLRSLDTMIEAITGDAPHEVAVVSYGEGPYLLGRFSSNPEAVQASLARLKPCGNFHAATIDAVYYAVQMLKRRPNDYRRAILLISETRDHGSRSKLHDVVAELGVTDTVIYSLAFAAAKDSFIEKLRNPQGRPDPGPSLKPWPPSPPPQPSPSPQPSPEEPRDSASPIPEPVYLDHAPFFQLSPKLKLAVNALRRNTASELASLSGGEHVKFATEKDLEDRLGRISNRIHNYYLLSFKPPSVPAFGLHSLKVRVPDYPDALIQTRRSYWSGVIEPAGTGNQSPK